MDTKPLLYLDVDGVLNARTHHPYREYMVDVVTATLPVSPFTNRFQSDLVTFTVRFDNRYPAWLAELAQVYEIVWATTWEHLANEHLSPLLDLPVLDYVAFSAEPATFSEVKNHDPAHWKWRTLLEHAGDRPFVFIDDNAGALSRTYPLSRGTSPGVLAPDPLERAHVVALLKFARQLASA